MCSVSDDAAVPAPKRPRTTKPVIETIIQKEASFDLPTVSPPAPPPVGTWSPENYEYEDYAREISMSVFDAANQNLNLLLKLTFGAFSYFNCYL